MAQMIPSFLAPETPPSERRVGLDGGEGRRKVVYETLYRYKGLEADVVILLDLPGRAKAVEPKDFYVAATRAKHLLVVVRLA